MRRADVNTLFVMFGSRFLYSPNRKTSARHTVGVPAGLVLICMTSCDFVRNYYFNILGGQVELAAWGVVQKIGNAFMQICVGIAQGIRPVVAFNYAAGLRKRVGSIINGGICVMAGWIAVCELLVALAPTFLVNILIPSGESVPVAVSYLRVWIWCLIGFGFIELFNAAFQSIGRWKISMINTIVNKAFLLTPVMIVLANLRGIKGIVISQPLTENLTAVVLFVIYLIVMRREQQSIAEEKTVL